MSGHFSRWMPAPRGDAPPSRVARLVGAGVGLAVLALVLRTLVVHPVATLALGVPLGALLWVGDRQGREARARWAVSRIAPDRPAEDIGTFARAFPWRADAASGERPDPWVVRAVWEAVLPMAAVNGQRVPIRPSDHFADDLGIDEEDVEALVLPILARVGRRAGEWRRNPYYQRGVRTVRDLVQFLSAQPVDPEHARWASTAERRARSA